MTEIKTWQQRCMEHHQNGQMVSEGMLRARMFEEIEELRAEIERLRARVEVLETALRYYADDAYNGHNTNGSCARAALEAKP
jgi:hypothetical protein